MQKVRNIKKIVHLFCLILLADKGFTQVGTWSGSATSTTTTDDVGIGDVTPDGKTEVHYCGIHRNGLIVTLTNDCPSNPGNSGPGGGIMEQGGGLPINLSNSLTVIGARNTMVRPLSWGRTESVDLLNPAMPPTYLTKYAFMPTGFNGFNIENPRASIDVIDQQYVGNENKVSAIFGSLNNHWNTPTQYSRHIHIVPNLGSRGYNSISQQGDLGIFYTDGMNQGANSNAGLVLAPWNDNSGGLTQDMGIRITPNGNVGIGTPLLQNPFGYKLAVNGVIGAKEVRVESFSAAWPDYVFEPEYNLRSLDSLKTYIFEHKHLPEMPSASEVKDDGFYMADMQSKLLLKVEELTLYIIHLEERLKSIEASK